MPSLPFRLYVNRYAAPEQVVIGVVGEVDIAAVPVLAKAINVELSTPGLRDLVLDLRTVTFMDSAGIGLLVRTRRVARAHHVEVTLACTHDDPVATTLRITGLIHVFATIDRFDVGSRIATGTDASGTY